MSRTLRTVRRNSREAREMWDKATRAVSFRLDNYFIGEDVSVDGARDWYERMAATRPRVTHNGSVYVVHYHSNHWLELHTAG
jgi:hypothetical protein